MLADGNYIFGGKQAVVYTELEICYTHETNVINQCYISKKLKIHENSSKILIIDIIMTASILNGKK